MQATYSLTVRVGADAIAALELLRKRWGTSNRGVLERLLLEAACLAGDPVGQGRQAAPKESEADRQFRENWERNNPESKWER